MNIYVGHAKHLNYREELYPSLKKVGEKTGVTFVLPHDLSDEPFPSKDVLPTCDLMVADVSLPALGLGIEIGWANMMEIPILFIHQSDSEFSRSIQEVSTAILSYKDGDDLQKLLTKEIKERKDRA